MYTRSFTRGFTLVELLVVISLMSFLAGLLLPAVQSSRETGRRIACLNNLRQLGIATSSYSNSHSIFPIINNGFSGYVSGVPTRYGCYSALTQLLPYIDLTPAYSALNFSRPGASDVLQGHESTLFVPDASNHTVARLVVSTFMCSSDPIQAQGPWAGTNYRTNLGVLMPAETATSHVPNESTNGAFTLLPTALGPPSFSDGLSHTVFFGEKNRGAPTTSFNRFVGYWINYSSTYTTLKELIATCNSPNAEPDSFQNDVGNLWLHPFYRYTFYNHNLGPNSGIPDCVGSWNSADPAIGNGAFAARSYHPGRVNVVFGDGHATSIENTIETHVWRALATRAGNELLEGGY